MNEANSIQFTDRIETENTQFECLRKRSVGNVARWIRNLAMIAIILITWILAVGCFDPRNGGAGVIEVNGLILKELQLDEFNFNPRISRSNHLVGLQSGRTFWLRKGEVLEVRYKTFETHWERPATNCNFDDPNALGDNCQNCDFCQAATTDFCRLTPTIPPHDALLSWPGYIRGDTAMAAVLNRFENNSYGGGCPASTDPITITPDQNATLQFTELGNRSKSIGEGKVHVLESGQTTTVAYQMITPQEIGQIDNANFWVWSTGRDPLREPSGPGGAFAVGDEVWTENFSPNMRVFTVRILKGQCTYDGPSGECVIPSGPIDEIAVMPSKVLFLPYFGNTVSGNVSEATHLCYPDASRTELGSFINLNVCRTLNNQTAPVAKLVTPTYDQFEQFYLGRLTWAVQFDNPSDTSDSVLTTPCDRATRMGCETMDPNQQLIIEFTLRAD